MPQNVLLHFPIVDLVCLQRSVREHTRRISGFIHEHNEYLNKCKRLISNKGITPFPLCLSEVPSHSTCLGDISLSEDEIFCASIEDKLIENDCTITSDINGGSDSVLSRVKLFELNSLYRGSDLEWQNSEEDFGNLTTISCPIRFPSEEKPIFFPVPGFETFGASPKALNHDIESIEKKYSEFVCEVGNDAQKIESLPSSLIKSVKKEQHDTKMEPDNGFEAMDGDDDVMVLKVITEKEIEIITIDDEEEEGSGSQVEQSTNPVCTSSRSLTTTAGTSENREIPSVDLTPPSLIPEVPGPSRLSPEIMEPLLTPDSSQPPLIFPEIDPPLWTFSGSSPVTSSDDVQPPILTPEAKDSPEADTTVLLVCDESQPPLMTSEELTPMTIDTETPESSSLPSTLAATMLVTVDSSTSESSRVPLTGRKYRQEFVTPIVGTGVQNKSTGESVSVGVRPQNLRNDTTSLQELEPPSSNSMELDDTMITPKKTTDITKIKGWKRKQFVMDKAVADEFSKSNKKKHNERQVVLTDDNEGTITVDETLENAFVCDSLDKFLEGEADLNINYEVPHLYAELGISLTKDDVLSRPNMSEEELKSFEGKYRVPIELKDNAKKLVKSGKVEKRGIKRKLNYRQRSSKARKLEVNGSKKSTVNLRRKKILRILCPNPKSTQTKVTRQRSSSGPIESMGLNGKAFEGLGTNKVLGLALYPGPNAPLPKLVQRHLDNIRSYRKIIDRNWANFALSALAVPKRIWYQRMILPIQFNSENLSEPKETTAVPTVVNEVVTELVDTACKEPSRQSSAEDVLTPGVSVVESQMSAKVEKPKRILTPGVSVVESQMSAKVEKPKRILTPGVSLVESQMSAEVEKPKRISRKRQRTDMKTDEQDSNVKDCEGLVSKVSNPSRAWCMEHSHYNCKRCGSDNVTRGESTNQANGGAEPREPNGVPTPSMPEKSIYSLLSLKLRSSRWRDLAITDIDILRNIVPNSLELIKCSLVRESFLNDHIFIWYLKLYPNLKNKSRVFLTFSNTPPVPYATRLKLNPNKNEEAVPKILEDIIMKKGGDDENEYAIMHCSEKVWEIYGSLRYATSNSNPKNFGQDCLKREEVFTPTYPPELQKISETGTKVIKEAAIRWWVVDLTQKFTTIVSNLESHINIMTRKRICNQIRTKFYGFLTLNKTSNRVLWVHVFPKLLPFILIGPYKLSEPHGLILKRGLNPVPFSYKSNLCTSPNFVLKKFLNSVITQAKEQNRELKALWLCEKRQVDKTCYVEMFTSMKDNNFSMSEYDLDVEHGYSLKSLIKSPPLKELKRACPQSMVYLYSDIPELGYLAAELLPYNKVIATNPVDNKSIRLPVMRFASWFQGILKENMQFVPTDLAMRWYVSKSFEELRDRQPFSSRYLKGVYMIYEDFPRNELKLANLKTDASYLRKTNVFENTPEEELLELKKLEYILYGSLNVAKSKEEIVDKAIEVIKELTASCNEQGSIEGRTESEQTISNKRSNSSVVFVNGIDKSIEKSVSTTQEPKSKLRKIEPNVNRGKKCFKNAPSSTNKIPLIMKSGKWKSGNSKATKVTKVTEVTEVAEEKAKETPTIPRVVIPAELMKKMGVCIPPRNPAQTPAGNLNPTDKTMSKVYLMLNLNPTPPNNSKQILLENPAQTVTAYSVQTPATNPTQSPARYSIQARAENPKQSPEANAAQTVTAYSVQTPATNPSQTPAGYSKKARAGDPKQTVADNPKQILLGKLKQTTAGYSKQILLENPAQTVTANSVQIPVTNPTQTPVRYSKRARAGNSKQTVADNPKQILLGKLKQTTAGYPKQILVGKLKQTTAGYSKQILVENPAQTPVRYSKKARAGKSKQTVFTENPKQILVEKLKQTTASYSKQSPEANAAQTPPVNSKEFLLDTSEETPAGCSKQTPAVNSAPTLRQYSKKNLADYTKQSSEANAAQTPPVNPKEFLLDPLEDITTVRSKQTPTVNPKEFLLDPLEDITTVRSKQTPTVKPALTLRQYSKQFLARYCEDSSEANPAHFDNSNDFLLDILEENSIECSKPLARSKQSSEANPVQTPPLSFKGLLSDTLEEIPTGRSKQTPAVNSAPTLRQYSKKNLAGYSKQSSEANSAQTPPVNSKDFLLDTLEETPAETPAGCSKQTPAVNSATTLRQHSKQSSEENPVQTPAVNSVPTLTRYSNPIVVGYSKQSPKANPPQTSIANEKQSSTGYSQQTLARNSPQTSIANEKRTPTGNSQQSMLKNSPQTSIANEKRTPTGYSQPTLTGNSVQTPAGNLQQTLTGNPVQTSEEKSKHIVVGNLIQSSTGYLQQTAARNPPQSSIVNVKQSPAGYLQLPLTEDSVKTLLENLKHTSTGYIQVPLTGDSIKTPGGSLKQILSGYIQSHPTENSAKTPVGNLKQFPEGFSLQTQEGNRKQTVTINSNQTPAQQHSQQTPAGNGNQSSAGNPEPVQFAKLDLSKLHLSNGINNNNNIKGGTICLNVPKLQIVKFETVKKRPNPSTPSSANTTNEAEPPNTKSKPTSKLATAETTFNLRPSSNSNNTSSEQQFTINPNMVPKTTTPKQPERAVILNPEAVRETTGSEQPGRLIIYNQESPRESTAPEHAKRVIICNTEPHRETTAPKQTECPIIINLEAGRETTGPEQQERVLVFKPETVCQTTSPGQVVVINPNAVPKSFGPLHSVKIVNNYIHNCNHSSSDHSPAPSQPLVQVVPVRREPITVEQSVPRVSKLIFTTTRTPIQPSAAVPNLISTTTRAPVQPSVEVPNLISTTTRTPIQTSAVAPNLISTTTRTPIQTSAVAPNLISTATRAPIQPSAVAPNLISTTTRAPVQPPAEIRIPCRGNGENNGNLKDVLIFSSELGRYVSYKIADRPENP